jgi:hypothetical protein
MAAVVGQQALTLDGSLFETNLTDGSNGSNGAR